MTYIKKQPQTSQITIFKNSMKITNNHHAKGSLTINNVDELHQKELFISEGGLNLHIRKLEREPTYNLNGSKFSINFGYYNDHQIGLCKNKKDELFLQFISNDMDFITKRYEYPYLFPLHIAKVVRNTLSQEEILDLTIIQLKEAGYFDHEFIGTKALQYITQGYHRSNHNHVDGLTLKHVIELDMSRYDGGIKTRTFIESLVDLFDLKMQSPRFKY